MFKQHFHNRAVGYFDRNEDPRPLNPERRAGKKEKMYEFEYATL